MNAARLHKIPGPLRTSALATAIVLCNCNVLARGDVTGRLFLTFQSSETDRRTERFTQHYEATLRDDVYYNNKLTLSLFFDDTKNLDDDLTYRRYRGHIDLQHRNYSVNVRIAPRQKTTALQAQRSQELTQNQISLDVHHPKAPRTRVVYSRRNTYYDGAFTGQSRDLRTDLDYRYKFLQARLNHWDTRSGNGTERKTSVTGGDIRGGKTFRQWLTVTAAYQYQQTESEQRLAKTNVKNNTLTGAVSARYFDWLWMDISGTARSLKTTGTATGRADNDNFLGRLSFFPKSTIKLNLSRTYLLTDTDAAKLRSDYGSGEVIVDGNIRKDTRGRLQVVLREDISTENGIVPPNIYFGSVRSRVREGIDLRAEVNVSQRQDTNPIIKEFQMSSVFEMFLQLRRNLRITPSANFVKFADRVTFLRNDRTQLGLRTNYFASSKLTMGVDVTQNRITTGLPRKLTSVTSTMSLRLRERSSMNVSYGVNEASLIDTSAPATESAERDSRTLSLQMRLWTSARGSVSFNYTDVWRERSVGTNDLAVAYRLDF